MASVSFKYEGRIIDIQCIKEDKMSDICNKLASKLDKNINSLNFLYNGKAQINYESTFYEHANSLDKSRLKMDILVFNNVISNELKCPKCGNNLYDNKILNDLIKYNNNINNMLNELKNQIEYINELDRIENKKRIIFLVIDDIINENKKFKKIIELNVNNELNMNNESNINNKLKENNTVNNNIIENNDNLSDDFDVKFKNPIYSGKCYYIHWAILLDDGRFAICDDETINIYNNKTFKPDLTINEKTYYILQLSTGNLAFCSKKNTIIIFNIENNVYQILQILYGHTKNIFEVIELNNEKLVSCSQDASLILYSKNNENYHFQYQIKTPVRCESVIQTKDNEICYYLMGGVIYFYNLIKKTIINKITKIKPAGKKFFNMMSKDLLAITGEKNFSIIDVNQYNIVRIIKVPDFSRTAVTCMLNENIILTGDHDGKIKKWRIEDDNLKLIYTKEKAHKDSVYVLIQLNDGHILSASLHEFKIW